MTIARGGSVTPTVDFTWLFLKMMVVLIVMCIAAVLVLKFLAPRSKLFQRMTQGQHLHVLSRASLGARQYIWLVRVGTRYFLLGAGHGGVTALAELTEKDVGESHEA